MFGCCSGIQIAKFRVERGTHNSGNIKDIINQIFCISYLVLMLCHFWANMATWTTSSSLTTLSLSKVHHVKKFKQISKIIILLIILFFLIVATINISGLYIVLHNCIAAASKIESFEILFVEVQGSFTFWAIKWNSYVQVSNFTIDVNIPSILNYKTIYNGESFPY